MIPDNTPSNKEPAEGSRETTGADESNESRQSDRRGSNAPSPKEGPLDGSTSGTIGGGGRATGGPTQRPKGPDMPPVDVDDAASGRVSPDPLAAETPLPDPLKPSPSSVTRH